MLKILIQLLLISLILSACFNTKEDALPTLPVAIIKATPEAIDLEVNTRLVSQNKPIQKITFTNIGQQPAGKFAIKGFEDESAPIIQMTTCDKDLAVGGSCEVELKLVTNHKLATSAAVSRSTVMKYEYNNASQKILGQIPVNFKIEKWIASVFLTNAATNGHIIYKRSDDLPAIKAGSDSADYYCRVDKNNPQNGYDYRALIYDTTNRTPYLHWVLFGGHTYYSVMPDTYHQKVWQTSYKQATVNNLLTNVYNCIGSNCINKPSSSDEAAWVGMNLNNNLMNMDTCGTAGNAWKSEQSKFHALTFAIAHGQDMSSTSPQVEDASCATHKKIICVSM